MRPISVAMPYWNRPRELTRSLAAYAKVYPDLDLEFSICDDGSVTPLEERAGCKVTRLPRHDHALNPCVPLNVAVRNASHDIIVLTSPEIEHREPVLYDMLAALTGPNDYVMTGCNDTQFGPIAGPGTPYGTNGRQPIPPGTDLNFCVMLHRELFERAEGFDEAYRLHTGCEDNDFLWSLYTLGGVNFKYVPGTVWHYRTPHRWPGTPDRSAAMLEKKYGHLPEFRACAS